ncbi:MAG: NAD(P)-dependent oxidoreductase, partial [Planctomycetaceae bacterium]
LINEAGVTPHDLHPSPIRSALFNSGKTSRINAAHFMVDLLDDDSLWTKWKGEMPVIYNRE